MNRPKLDRVVCAWVLASFGLLMAPACAAPSRPNYPWHEASFASQAVSACAAIEQCVTQCEAGQPEICESLGYLYETGERVPQSYAKAADLYARACTGGRGESCTRLAVMYDIGLSVAEDSPRAIALYGQACQLGEIWSCNRADELR
jgi:TPR repeat protein